MTGEPLASFGSRALALLIDSLVSLVVTLPIWILAIALLFASFESIDLVGDEVHGFGIGTFLGFFVLVIAASIATLVYAIWGIGGPSGQTLGKHYLRIRVIHDRTGGPVGYGSAALRELIGKWLSGAVVYLGYLWMLWASDGKTWHDSIATTHVVSLPATSETSVRHWWNLARGRATHAPPGHEDV